jgi:hypothetical protein
VLTTRRDHGMTRSRMSRKFICDVCQKDIPKDQLIRGVRGFLDIEDICKPCMNGFKMCRDLMRSGPFIEQITPLYVNVFAKKDT